MDVTLTKSLFRRMGISGLGCAAALALGCSGGATATPSTGGSDAGGAAGSANGGSPNGGSANGGSAGAAGGSAGSSGSAGSDCAIGKTWTQAAGPDERVVTSIAAAQGTVWAGTHYGLLHSQDGGATWTRAPELAGDGDVVAVAAFLSDVFAGVVEGKSGHVLHSADGGATWTYADDGLPSGPQPSYLHAQKEGVVLRTGGAFGRAFRWSPNDQAWVPIMPDAKVGIESVEVMGDVELVSSAFEGVFLSKDSGASFTLEGAISPLQTTAISLTPARVFVTGTGGYLFRSDDAGALWVDLPELPPSTGNADDLLDTGTAVLASTENGIARSDDGGTSFQLTLAAPPATSLPNVASSQMALATDVNGADKQIFAARDRVLRSGDDGVTWKAAGSLRVSKPIFLGSAGSATFATTSDMRTQISIDHGATWQSVPFPAPGAGTLPSGITDLAPHGDALFALWSEVAPLVPAYFPAGRIGRSTNGGKSFQALSFPPISSTLSAIEPAGDVLFVGTRNEVMVVGAEGTPAIADGGEGIFRSSDGGLFWENASDGLPYVPGPKGALVASVIALQGIGSDVLASLESEGLYRSTDAGSTWAAVSGVQAKHVTSFAVLGKTVVGFSSEEPVMVRSLDGGATFSALVPSGLPDWLAVNSVATYGDLIFAVVNVNDPKGLKDGKSNGVFWSKDAGTTWTALAATLEAPAVSLAVQSDTLWAGTYGHAAFQLPLGPCAAP